MKCVVFLYALATVAILVPGGLCDERAEEQALRRNRRTVQFLVNHFVQFLGLSGAGAGGGTKKVEPKQDNVFTLPLTNVFKASAGKFSGFSGGKPKPAPSNREPTLQHDLPTWIEDRKGSNAYSEAFEADSLEPTRVSLFSTTQEPAPETTTATTTTTTTTTEAPMTTTPESAPIAPTDGPEEQEQPEATTVLPEPSTSQPEQAENTSSPQGAEDQPLGESDGASNTEPSAIDPAAVNTLSDTRIDVRNGFRDDSFQPTPIPLVSYQHYVHPGPVVWPGTGFQANFPAQQYFGNNVFFPAQGQFPLASPFQLQPAQHSQGYPSNQPAYDNQLYYPTAAAAPAKSHSRVKLHDNPYDLVTYHDDTEPAASTYQMQTFGNYRARRY
uniref:Uncharacterized protein n=1 Tax=Anopheles atroparvus TaxID=41427 RepID=A0A182JFX3_ANOAO